MEIYLSLLSSICLGLHNGIARKPLQILSPDQLFFWREQIVVIILLPFLLLYFPEINIEESIIKNNLIKVIIAGILGYPVVALIYGGIKMKGSNPGLVGTAANSYLPLVMVFAFFFLDETLELVFMPKATLIFAGVLLISLPKGKEERKNTKGVYYGIGAMIVYSVIFVLFKPATIVLGPILAAFVMRVSGLATVGSVLKLKKDNFKFPRKDVGTIIILGILMATLILAMAFAFSIKDSNTSLVISIIGANPLVTLLYSRFVYKMKITKKQLFGVLLTIVGIIFIAN